MKVLLISPPLREHYPPDYFPFGIVFVAQSLIKAGHDVQIFDININRYSREQVVEELKKVDCDIIGTGGLVTVYKYLKWLIPVVKKTFPNKKIIIGGSLATGSPKETLDGLGVDFVVLGEGELTSPELFGYLEKHEKPDVEELKQIKGIAFKHEGKVIYSAPREVVPDLDAIGLPDWDLIDMEKFLKFTNNSMNIQTERGCPFRCNFCYHQFGYKQRRRSFECIIKEIKTLKKKYGVTSFGIEDNLFVYNVNEVNKLTKLLKKNNLKIHYMAAMRASLVSKELVIALKKSGCTGLNFGFESGSQKVLNLMNKMTTIEQMDRAIDICEKYKIPYFGTFIIGYPGETKEDIDQTIEFCVRHNILAKPFFATPYPGTPLYGLVRHKIKNMDKFLESLGDARDLIINISEFGTKELLAQRRRVATETEKAYLKKHPILRIIFSPVKLLNVEEGFVVKTYIETPFPIFVKTALSVMSSYIKGIRLVPMKDSGYDKQYTKRKK